MANHKVKMTHPQLPGVVIERPRSAVPVHMASGWMPEDKPAPKPVTLADSGAAQDAAEDAKSTTTKRKES